MGTRAEAQAPTAMNELTRAELERVVEASLETSVCRGLASLAFAGLLGWVISCRGRYTKH